MGRTPNRSQRSSQQRRSSRRSPSGSFLVVAGVVWAIVFALTLLVFHWRLYVAWVAGGTLATALLFAFDKMQSKGVGQRVPEAVLLTLVVLGGVIGGWIGMLFVRHKTKHPSFWLVQWISTALHLGLVWWLFYRAALYN